MDLHANLFSQFHNSHLGKPQLSYSNMNLRVSLPTTLLILASSYPTSTIAEAQGYEEILKTRSSLTMVSEATYSCTFTNLWTSRRHPTLYPGNAHWSSPVLTSHSEEYTMWEPGVFASPGIEVAAEVGHIVQRHKSCKIALKI